MYEPSSTKTTESTKGVIIKLSVLVFVFAMVFISVFVLVLLLVLVIEWSRVQDGKNTHE